MIYVCLFGLEMWLNSITLVYHAQGLEFDTQHCKIKQNAFVLPIYLVEKYKKGWEDSSVCKVLKHKHKDLNSDPQNRHLKVGWGCNITSL